MNLYKKAAILYGPPVCFAVKCFKYAGNLIPLKIALYGFRCH